LPFVRYQNFRSAMFGFITKHACDRRTDAWMRRAVKKAQSTQLQRYFENKLNVKTAMIYLQYSE